MTKYIPTIGIECHVQLATKTKLFAPVDNDARGAAPNTKVSAICLGMPGVLPVLNQAAVDYAIIAGLALNAEIPGESVFERKHYFYPDLPKGYQITQLERPIVAAGHIDVPVGDTTVRVRINRAQLEEDAGKSTHPTGSNHTLVDLNRAGTPLLEIVSEPDMHSAEEARAYAHELYLIMKYTGVSDVDLYHGNMRFDVNVSLAPEGSSELGVRTETKNLNSFKSVERAVEFEIKRQTEILSKGEKVLQETRGWDDDKGKTLSQRRKEEAHDYRYFPDPDIPPVVIDRQTVEAARARMSKLPSDYRASFTQAGLSRAVVESILEDVQNSELVATALEANTAHGKRIALWTVNVVAEKATDQNTKKLAGLLADLSQMVEDDKISATNAKEIYIRILTEGGNPQTIADEMNLLQDSDVGHLQQIVDAVISDNQQAVEDIRAGEEKAIGFLVGQVMKASKGKANPAIAQEVIRKTLED